MIFMIYFFFLIFMAKIVPYIGSYWGNISITGSTNNLKSKLSISYSNILILYPFTWILKNLPIILLLPILPSWPDLVWIPNNYSTLIVLKFYLILIWTPSRDIFCTFFSLWCYWFYFSGLRAYSGFVHFSTDVYRYIDINNPP